MVDRNRHQEKKKNGKHRIWCAQTSVQMEREKKRKEHTTNNTTHYGISFATSNTEDKGNSKQDGWRKVASFFAFLDGCVMFFVINNRTSRLKAHTIRSQNYYPCGHLHSPCPQQLRSTILSIACLQSSICRAPTFLHRAILFLSDMVYIFAILNAFQHLTVLPTRTVFGNRL